MAQPKRGLGQAHALPNLQGVGSNLDDLLLRGKSWRSQLGDAFTDGTLTRTYSGASTVTVNVRDEGRELLTSPLLQEAFNVTLDDLGFSFVKASSQGILSPLGLTFEDDVVHRLRQFKGPKKAYRDKVTRAEFVRRLVLEASKGWREIPFFAYELHIVQPIATAKQAADASATADSNRGPGLTHGVDNLTVKGVKATASQIDLGEMALRIASSLKAPRLATMALMEALIVESVMGIAAPGNVLEGEGAPAGAPIGSAADEISGFLTNKPEWTGHPAIPYANAHPDAAPHEVAQHVQASGAGLASNGAANYGPWEKEAGQWIDAFGGGTFAGGSVTTTTPERYAFEVGKKETYWTAITRLASEVRWRAFCSAGKVYFVNDDYLLASRRRMLVGPHAEGVDDISFDYDTGKDLNEVRVTARAHQWSAPPGSCVRVSGQGPADGDYLVSQIDAPLRRIEPVSIDVTLRRPAKPLPEPAPQTKTSTTSLPSVGSSGNATLDKMVAEAERIIATHTTYQMGGGHEAPPSAHGPYDCSGYVSRILYVGGFTDHGMATGELAGWGEAGAGSLCTVLVHNGGEGGGHTIMRLGDRWTECGGRDNPGNGGPVWFTPSASRQAEFETKRHPKGL